MVLGLRVACDATEEPPVPGEEPAKLRIATPVGRFQLIRDLPQEQINAEKIVRELPLENWQSEGPFSWKTDSDDAALQLIQRFQQMGTTHLPSAGHATIPCVWSGRSRPNG